MQACKIDSEGFFIEDVLGVSQEDLDTDPLLVRGPATGGLFRPRWDGAAWVEGDGAADQKRLDGALASALAQIDAAAESARGRYATLQYTQGATYRTKEKWARQFAADGYPETAIADYPYVAEEAQRTGQTGKEVADRMIANAGVWEGTNRLNPIIEAERVGGKADCRTAHAAGDLGALTAARDSAVVALGEI